MCQSPTQLASTNQIEGVFNFAHQCFRRTALCPAEIGLWDLEHSQATIFTLRGMEHMNTESRH